MAELVMRHIVLQLRNRATSCTGLRALRYRVPLQAHGFAPGPLHDNATTMTLWHSDKIMNSGEKCGKDKKAAKSDNNLRKVCKRYEKWRKALKI